MPSLAVVLIAGTITERMLARVRLVNPHEFVIVGDYHAGADWRYLPMPAQGPPSVVARMRRDVATLATTSDYLLFVEGYSLAPHWGEALKRHWRARAFDILVPMRVTDQVFLDPWATVPSGAVYRRALLQQMPFGMAPPGPYWAKAHTDACQALPADVFVAEDLWLEPTETGVTPHTATYRKALHARWREPPASRWTDPTLPGSPNPGSPSWSALCARLSAPTRFSKPGAFSATPPPTSPSASTTGAGDG